MKQYTKVQRIRFSEEQVKSLVILKEKYRIKPSSFIRQAIKEKIQRDLPGIIKQIERGKQNKECPF